MPAVTPFFSRRLSDWVVDEMCACGTLRSKHGSLVENIEGHSLLRLEGEGNGPNCPKFRFFDHVTASQYVAIVEKENVQVA